MKESSEKTKLQSADSFLEYLPDDIKFLIELSDNFIFQLDLSWEFKNINKYGASILDYEPLEIIGKSFFDFLKSFRRNNAVNAFNEAVNKNKIEVFEAVILGKSKSEYNFKFRIRPLNQNGKVVGIFGIGKNISTIKKLEEKISELTEKLKEAKRIIAVEKSRSQQNISLLEELNKMKTEFISNISHEFRTPLASIIGFSESISSDPAMTADYQKEFNEIILSEGKKLAKLINDVLDMTRLEVGEIELNKIRFNFSLLIKEVSENLKDEIQKKQLSISKEFPDEEILLYGDKEKLSQVFYEIFGNAIKFTGRGGRISIIVHVLFREIEVIITDTGIGISQKKMPSIFQNYYNSVKLRDFLKDYDSKRNLGLVFVKYIVDLHKGSISIQSEVNEGTTVIVKLLKED